MKTDPQRLEHLTWLVRRIHDCDDNVPALEALRMHVADTNEERILADSIQDANDRNNLKRSLEDQNNGKHENL